MTDSNTDSNGAASERGLTLASLFLRAHLDVANRARLEERDDEGPVLVACTTREDAPDVSEFNGVRVEWVTGANAITQA